MKKNEDASTGTKKWAGILYIISIIAAVLFIVSPLLIRLPFFRAIVSFFLQSLGDSAYKNSYISMISSLLGSFLAITGAIWTQRFLTKIEDEKKKKEAEEKMRKEADLLFYEIIAELIKLQTLLREVYPREGSIRLSFGGDAYNHFCGRIRQDPIICDSSLRKSIYNIRDKVSGDAVKSLLEISVKLEKIAVLTDPMKKEHGPDDYQIAYHTLCTIFPSAAGRTALAAVTYELGTPYKDALNELVNYAEVQIKDKKTIAMLKGDKK